MKRLSFLALILALIAIPMMVYLASCGGGGGGDDEQQAPPPPGGTGTGAGGVTIFWYPYDTNIAMGSGNAVQETSDHGFIVTGSQSSIQGSSLGPQEVSLMKIDPKGTATWKKRFPWPGGAEAFAVRETTDGGFIVTGQTYTYTNTLRFPYRVYMLKTDSSGNAAAGWPKIYGGANSGSYAVLEIGGGYLTAGYTTVMEGDNQEHSVVHVMLWNASGTVEWQKTYSHFCAGGNEIARALAPATDGNFVIAGYTGCYGWKGILIKIDGEGNELWRKVYDQSAATLDTVSSVATATDGFVLAGSRDTGQPPAGKSDAFVIKTDLNGAELWRKTYGGAERDAAFTVALDQHGDYLVFGFTHSFKGPVDPAIAWQYDDLFLIKLDGSGNTLWQKVKGNWLPGSDYGAAGCVVSDGGFAVTGSSGGNVLLAKFDANGDTIDLGPTDFSYLVPATTGLITVGNAVNVGSAGVAAFMEPRSVGATALDLLIAALKGEPPSDFCNGGGTYAFSPAPSSPLSAGTYTFTFSDCVSGPGGDSSTLNGGAAMIVESVSGDPLSATYTVQTTLAALSISIQESGGTLSNTVIGEMRFRRAATPTQFSERAESINAPPTTLTLVESGATTTLSQFLMRFSMNLTSGAYGFGTVSGDSATVDFGLGPLLVTFPSTSWPVQGPSLDTAPTSGKFKVSAPDDSSVTATVKSGGVVTLEVDTDGNGTADGTVSAAWDDLY